jgi:lysophospholipase L1-like esterase
MISMRYRRRIRFDPRPAAFAAAMFLPAIALGVPTGSGGPPSPAAVADAFELPAGYPDPARFEAEIDAFTAADREQPPPEGALLCIGSSSMRFWHATLARDLAPRTVIPRGFGGSTMADVLHFAPRVVLPYRPAAILLYEGDNDIDFGVAPEDFLAVFARFVALVETELPRTRILVMSIKPSPARWAEWPAMRAANALLAAACADDPRLWYVDVATPMLDRDGQVRRELFLPDLLHLNESGYAVWREVVRAALTRAGS